MNPDLSELGVAEQSQLVALLAKLRPTAAKKKKKRARTPPTVEKIKYFTEDQIRRLFKAIESPRDTAMFRVAYHRGLRAAEVGMIQLDDLNLRDCRIRFARLKGSIGGEYHLCA